MTPTDSALSSIKLHSMSRWSVFGLVAFIAMLGCSSDVLTTKVPCQTDSDCSSSQSCFQDACTDDYSIVSGLPCDQTRQCEGGNTCFEFFCTPGCTDVYYTSDCPEDYFCKPTTHNYASNEFGERSLLGECAESECSSDGECAEGESCIELGLNVGACVKTCTYGFNGDTYEDTCVRQDGLPHDCHPLGVNQESVCLPAGANDGPSTGEAGCDSIRRPCAPGNICVNLVCRALCRDNQLAPCPDGYSCTGINNDASLEVCRPI